MKMTQAPLVSVITIFLNAERFIEEAIESVLSQSYRTWELLLVDDGSTDGSTAIARHYMHLYPHNVRYLEHEGHQNRGTSASRNLGLQHASGEYIAFLDADDVWLPNILEQQVDILNAYPEAAMVYGPIEYWYSWTGKTADMQRDYVEDLGVPSDSLVNGRILLARFLRDVAAVPSGLLVRHAVVRQIDGFEDSFQREYEDQVFCAKICLQHTVFASSCCWYRYRQHDDSTVAVAYRTGETRAARYIFLDWLATYLREQEITDRAVWHALRWELWRWRHPGLFRSMMHCKRRWEGIRQKIYQELQQ